MRYMWMCRKLAAGGVKLPNGVTCDGRLWSDGRADKHVPRCGNPSTFPAIRSVVQPALPLLWCLGATSRTDWNTWSWNVWSTSPGRFCRSRWRPWCREWVVSSAVGRWLTPGVFRAHRRRFAMRPMCRMMGAQ
jgi:hypothetical protein